MAKKEKLRGKGGREKEDVRKGAQKSTVVLPISDSDDGELGNEDLNMRIIKKAMSRASQMTQSHDPSDEARSNNGAGSSGVIDLTTSSPSEEEASGACNAFSGDCAVVSELEEGINRKKRKKRKKVKNIDFEERSAEEVMDEETIDAVKDVEIITSMETNPIQMADNMVLKKLLRGPRYFDPPDSGWGACYNCGEEGHLSANCTAVKRKRPCFLCGSLEHGYKQCTKGQDCFICKKGGHRAKDCPEKQKGGYQNSKMCLRCGDFGHDMFYCRNDYPPDDLKEIQCYVCKSFGHLCCVSPADSGCREVSCYRCGQPGHTGLACLGSHEKSANVKPSRTLFDSGEGHFVRKCTSSIKAGKRNRDPATPKHKVYKAHTGPKSAPTDMAKGWRKTKAQYEGMLSTPPNTSRRGWVTEHPGDAHFGKAKSGGGWRSPSTPAGKGCRIPDFGGPFSGSRFSSNKAQRVYYSGTPNSQGFPASRFGSSCVGAKWNYNWW